ncbi:division/cell wall cluster transcriptional repressor MraZ [Thermococcus prieurii]
MEALVKKFDSQGRRLIPREIRKKLGDEVIIVDLGDRVELLPGKKQICGSSSTALRLTS